MIHRCASLALVLGGLVAPLGAAGADAQVAAAPFEIEAPAGPLAFRGAIAVSPPDPAFGGLSGLLREPDGAFVAISDRGAWVRFALVRDGGLLTGLKDVATTPMLDEAGVALEGKAVDAEALTRASDGRYVASFEGDHRMVVYETPGAPASATIRAPEWRAFGRNSGLEALATAPDGRLWAIRERSGAADRPFPVHIVDLAADPAGAPAKTLPRRGPYLPTGADFGPDGRVYVTERAFSFTGGFRFRLRRVTWGDGPAPVEEETLLELGAASRIDNIEAIALWREDARTFLLLVSDDNFFPLQRNVFALYEVMD